MTDTPQPGDAANARSRILYVEECPSRDISYHYVLDDANAVIKVPSPKVLGKSESPSSDDVNASRLFLFFRSVFLPAGFPHSVSKDYVAYQTWDTVQAFASSISSSLATRVRRVCGPSKVCFSGFEIPAPSVMSLPPGAGRNWRCGNQQNLESKLVNVPISFV